MRKQEHLTDCDGRMKRARFRFHPPTMAMDRALKPEALAFDRASVRALDADGRLHVATSHISRAMVCPYLGSEIPGFVELGLDADKIYNLFRDPDELAKAAPTFNNLPLLADHKPVSAIDPAKDLVVGSTGTDAAFDGEFLDNSLVVWDQPSIDAVQSGQKRELSCAYRYVPDMTKGTFEGAAYDGVMRSIVGNHVALVSKGRAGSDVVVGDSAATVLPKRFRWTTHIAGKDSSRLASDAAADSNLNLETSTMATKPALTRKAALVKGALAVYLRPQLAQDAQMIDLMPIVAGVTAANWKEQKPKIVAAVTTATKGKLAQDADLEDMPAMLDNMDADDPDTVDDPVATPDPAATVEKPDSAAAVLELLSGKVPPELLDQVKNILAGKTGDDAESIVEKIRAIVAEAGGEKKPAQDAPPATPGTPEAPTTATTKDKPAMDAAQIDALVNAKVSAALANANNSAIAHINAIAEAKEAVRPLVGEIAVAMDSAAAVYKVALDAGGVDIEGVPEAAYPKMVKQLRSQQIATANGALGAIPTMAADAASGDSFAKRFPQAGHVTVL
jgi:hypothetical protein